MGSSCDFPHIGEPNPLNMQMDKLNNNQGEAVGMEIYDCDASEPEDSIDSHKNCILVSSSIDISYSNGWYSDKPPEICDCPFKSFHHSGLPSEFLHYPHYHTSDKRSQQILAGIGDHSSGVCVKIQFIVNNLKDCQGIWAQLFLQKLNAIIVHADHVTVRAVLSKDNFTVLKELIDHYANEAKCDMVNRYWCLCYNAFTRNLVPVLPSELKNKLMAQFQKDFSVAVQNLCRCKSDTHSNSNSESAPDEAHNMISSLTQMNIIAVLMYYLTCKVGDHSDNTCDIYKDTPPALNAEKFMKEILVRLYTQLYENCQKESPEAATILMETLSHVLIAFHNIPSEKNLFATAIDVMLDMGFLSAAVKTKNMLLCLLAREFNAFQKGPGTRLIFIDPSMQIYFATLGVASVLKCLNNLISNVEYPILLREEQIQLMNMMITIQSHLGESTIWNGEYENIYLHCRDLQCTLEKKLGFHMSDIKLDSDTETANESGILEFPDCSLADSSASSPTSQSKLQSSVMLSRGEENMTDDWMVDTKNISKLRKGYAHEINANSTSGQQKEDGWVSRWMARTMEYFVNCGKCCNFTD